MEPKKKRGRKPKNIINVKPKNANLNTSINNNLIVRIVLNTENKEPDVQGKWFSKEELKTIGIPKPISDKLLLNG